MGRLRRERSGAQGGQKKNDLPERIQVAVLLYLPGAERARGAEVRQSWAVRGMVGIGPLLINPFRGGDVMGERTLNLSSAFDFYRGVTREMNKTVPYDGNRRVRAFY